MTKKAKPRRGEYGFSDEAAPFDLTDEQAAHLWDLIVLTDQNHQGALRTRLGRVSHEHLERLEDEKIRPGLAEQNAALSEILSAARQLEDRLREVDHLSQDELFKALGAVPFLDEDQSAPEGGFDQYQNLRVRLEHFTRGLDPHLKRLKTHRGRTENRLPKIFVREVVQAYEEVTGNLLTHTANVDGNYAGRVQSPAGRFILALAEMVDTTITEQTLCSILAEYVSQRK